MPHRRTVPTVLTHSRELRQTQTEAEARLWRALRKHKLEEVHFRRQHAMGPYVVDFCAPRQKLIVEVDGGQHLVQETYDRERTTFLEAKGYRVLRFWNNQVLEELEGVVKAILDALAEQAQIPTEHAGV